MTNRNLTFCDINDQYMKAKRNIGICNCSNKYLLSIQGDNALNLINNFSNKTITLDESSSCVGLYCGKRFIDEVFIFQITPKKFILVCNNIKLVLKKLKSSLKKYSYTVLNDITKQFTLFSFHGKNSNGYFDILNNKYLFKINHQGYTYYNLLVPKKEDLHMLNYFLSQKFISINLETKRLFLYNNKVISDFKNLGFRFRKYLLQTIYPKDNEFSLFSVELFEALDYSIIPKKTKILDYKRGFCGIVCNSYKLPSKKYPFLIGLVTSSNNNILIIKCNKKEILIRKLYKNYEPL